MSENSWSLELNLPSEFGDTGREWTEGRAIVWKAFQMGAKITPPARFGDGDRNVGWWLGLADLLCFGAGVDDIVEFLENSRNLEGSRLRNFILANWGDSVSLLELYLRLHPRAREAVSSYAAACRNSDSLPAERERTDVGDLYLNGSYAGASIGSPLIEELASALHLRKSEIVVENLREPRDGDPAHFAAHFGFLWGNASRTLEPEDTVELARNGYAVLHLRSYANWYAKVHALRTDFASDSDFGGSVDVVEVRVHGLDSIGIFVFDQVRQCFVLECEQTVAPEVVRSPRFLFKLAPEMKSAFRSLGEIFDINRSASSERVELLVRDEVDLAHSLTYQISNPEGSDSDWTRLEGSWQSGSVIPEGLHFERCKLALLKSGHLEMTMPEHEAVLDSSVVHEVAPWAYEKIVNLWDAGREVRSFMCTLAGMPQGSEVAYDSLASGVREKTAEYVESLRASTPPDSGYLIQDLVDWLEGAGMSAEELLTAIVEAETSR